MPRDKKWIRRLVFWDRMELISSMMIVGFMFLSFILYLGEIMTRDVEYAQMAFASCLLSISSIWLWDHCQNKLHDMFFQRHIDDDDED